MGIVPVFASTTTTGTGFSAPPFLSALLSALAERMYHQTPAPAARQNTRNHTHPKLRRGRATATGSTPGSSRRRFSLSSGFEVIVTAIPPCRSGRDSSGFSTGVEKVAWNRRQFLISPLTSVSPREKYSILNRALIPILISFSIID